MTHAEDTNSSILGRLLEEISWDGAQVRAYPDGGRGRENVLTAEVLTALDFLPRARFLGGVVRAAHGATKTTARISADAEAAEIVFLPDEVVLNPDGRDRGARLIVQPDAMITGPDRFVLLEAKGMRTSSIQPEQLAREYLAVTAHAGDRVPLLLLVLGSPPPVAVTGHGRLCIAEAIEAHLPGVYARTAAHPVSLSALSDRLPESYAWITWAELTATVVAQHSAAAYSDPSIAASVARLVSSLTRATRWHR